MKTLFLSLIVASSIYAYEGCGDTREEALENLSGNIKTRVNSNYVKSVKAQNNDSVESKISTYLQTSSKLTLVNVSYTTNEKKETCANVNHDDQVKSTQKLLNKALAFKKDNLPNDIDEKIKKLDSWLKDLEELSFLVPTFLDNKDKEQEILNKNEKLFQDLYDSAIAKSNSLVWRSCSSSNENAKDDLNKLLFVDKGVKEDEGFWASVASVFTPSEDPDIEYFKDNINYTVKKDKLCAMIKKDELLLVATKMNNEAKRFSSKTFDKNPKKRYEQNKVYMKQFALTKKLISLYPKTFKNSDFSNLTRARDLVVQNQKTTNPQFVKFNVISKTAVQIKLDNKLIKNKEEFYLAIGEHSYTIDTPQRCQISGSFEIDLLDDENIDKDFTDYMYPSVNFVTNKKPTIVIDGNNVAYNKAVSIKKCSEENIRYIAKFADQTREGEITLGAGDKNTVELKFLTATEMAVFIDTKTKNFKTTSDTKFSESLTTVNSKILEFSVTSNVSHGELRLHSAGSFTYKSDKEFVGVDSFTYEITANGEDSAPKVVNITVNNSNAPVAIIVPQENNETKEEKEEEVKEEKKEELTKEEIEEEKYKRFEEYMKKQDPSDTQKINSIKAKNPELFDKFINNMAP